MPKILEANGFVLYFYPQEENERHHELHIHIYRGSITGEAMVVQIPNLKILVQGMKASDARQAIATVRENLEEIKKKVGIDE